MDALTYCSSLTNYSRLKTDTIYIGDIPLGGNFPIRIQSMTNTNTLDTKATVEQCIRMIHAGCEFIRITTPSIQDAENLTEIKKLLKQKGYKTPLIADVHFNSKIAEIAATLVEKVRINPGNYVDKRNQAKLEFTDSEYNNEIERIKERIKPLIHICKNHGTVLRIGSNHGSLSDRILSRYGNTPKGMVEAAMEFLRICVDLDFRNIVVSMKSSNTKIMVQSTRLLSHTMMQENMHFPIHLGVTEAGEGEDGRIRSAVGIGALLEDGIGDTIRVSLSEDPELELPIAKKLTEHYTNRHAHNSIPSINSIQFNPFTYQKRTSKITQNIGGNLPPLISSEINVLANKINIMPVSIDSFNIKTINENNPIILHTANSHGMAEQRFIINSLMANNVKVPVICSRTYTNLSAFETSLFASSDFGALLIDGLCDGIQIKNDTLTPDEIKFLELAILQASGTRISKTEFISCPTCGRTQFQLNKAITEVKQKTGHLLGLKIAVMGCIVNGPGEMADADYGYVGSGNSKVTLFKKQIPILKNIPEEDAVSALIELIKQNGDWKELT